MSGSTVYDNIYGNVLVTSHDDAICMSLRSLLEREGYGVYICKTFEELSTLEHQNLRIALIDISESLPSTLHAIEFIRQSPSGANIPILVSSESPSSDTIVAALNVGATDYIIKPFSNRELMIRIKSLSKTN